MVQVVSSRLLPLKRFTVISPVNPPDALAVPLSTVDVCPPQSVTSGPAFTVGKGLTYTVTWSWLVQVPWVAVSVYVVVVVGLAVGFRMVVELNAVAGLQVYVRGNVLVPPLVPQLATEMVVELQGPTDPEATLVPLQVML
jgi:hypothetical protein